MGEEAKRILVIDDDPIYRELLAIALNGGGFRVLLAENGLDAQEILGRESVDAVIVDMLMPYMDGLRFLHWLREEQKSPVPALVVTSSDDRNLSVEALVVGATDVLVKPVRLDALSRKIQQIL